jgi:hypothetical protein
VHLDVLQLAPIIIGIQTLPTKTTWCERQQCKEHECNSRSPGIQPGWDTAHAMRSEKSSNFRINFQPQLQAVDELSQLGAPILFKEKVFYP